MRERENAREKDDEITRDRERENMIKKDKERSHS